MRHRIFLRRSLLCALLWIAPHSLVPLPAGAQDFVVERLVDPGALLRPVFLASPPGDRDRGFVLEQHTGQIRIVRLADGSVDPQPFLAIPGITTGSEQGLLGLAFHPGYAENGFLYVNYTDGAGATVVERYQVSEDADVALPDSGLQLLRIVQPQPNHNGGWIGFSPTDGFLYIATGDGGNADDLGTGHTAEIGNGQDITDNLLGKILRIDVDGDDFPADDSRNYAIPEDNPFVGIEGDDEIWSYGLRNPYRCSFDRETGDLYIGDVGQNAREEIDVQPDGVGGLNFGWRLREGTIETPTGGVGGDRPPGNVDPVFDYLRGTENCTVGGSFRGCVVTGGTVYRGPVASLRDRYFFADFATSQLWSFIWDESDPATFDGSNFTDLTDHSTDPAFAPDEGAFAEISAITEDDAGNLYILRLGRFDGQASVFRLVPEPGGAAALGAGASALALLRRRAASRRSTPGP